MPAKGEDCKDPGRELAIAITGAGGAGVISCGELLLKAWAREGGRGVLRRAFGPQIRGGESAALLTFCEGERYTVPDKFRLLVALDWVNFSRFEDEIGVGPDTLVLCEKPAEVPVTLLDAGVRVKEVPLSALRDLAHSEGRINMVALGLLGAELGLPLASLCQLARTKLADKDATYIDAAVACIDQGYSHPPGSQLQPPSPGGEGAWCLSGNQAAAYGALQAGVRFVAAYPITPASDALEWMAGAMEKTGGRLVQAEDELAAINMVLGAAFGGVPAFTATSGPGLALMSESIGLGVASETPVCVLNVMRGGPSTGIPTRSEQSDLSIAVYGLHGDAPHLVLAPRDTADCIHTTYWAVRLSEYLQTPAIVLSDQLVGQSLAVISEPGPTPWTVPDRVRADTEETPYQRYRVSESGISPIASPGMSGTRFTADGLEHTPSGTPSSRDSDHALQLDKRQRKLDSFDYGCGWADVGGEGALALLCFGSTSAAVEHAAQVLRQQGEQVRTVVLRLLAPLNVKALEESLADCSILAVVEQNHSAQLLHYLCAHGVSAESVISIARPGPIPIAATEIVSAVKEVL